MLGAIEQTAAYPTYPTSNARLSAFDSYLKPPLTKTIWPDYLDPDLPPLEDRNGRPASVYFAPASIHDDHVSLRVHLAPGQLVDSNLAANPHLVRLTGAKIVGIDREYNDVLEISRRPASCGRAGREPPARRNDRDDLGEHGTQPADRARSTAYADRPGLPSGGVRRACDPSSVG